jgi:hypothetical protein
MGLIALMTIASFTPVRYFIVSSRWLFVLSFKSISATKEQAGLGGVKHVEKHVEVRSLSALYRD